MNILNYSALLLFSSTISTCDLSDYQSVLSQHQRNYITIKMGWVLSKFRKSKSTMEVLTKLDADIKSIVEFKVNPIVDERKDLRIVK